MKLQNRRRGRIASHSDASCAIESTGLVCARDVRKSYAASDRAVLGGVDLEIGSGEFVAIVGPSGSGKSTLLYCLAGLETTDSGSVAIDGFDISNISDGMRAEVRRKYAGFVFQDYNLIDSLTVSQNIDLSLRIAGLDHVKGKVNSVLAEFQLEKLSGRYPSQLSGGQRQRVAIARVSALEPSIVFADEPTGALDTESGRLVLRWMRRMSDSGSAVILVTHDLDIAASADRVIVLRDGLIREEMWRATPERILRAMGNY